MPFTSGQRVLWRRPAYNGGPLQGELSSRVADGYPAWYLSHDYRTYIVQERDLEPVDDEKRPTSPS